MEKYSRALFNHHYDFGHPIKNELLFAGITVIHLLESDLSYSDVIAINGQGIIWRAQQKLLNHAGDRFVSIGKKDENIVTIISYYGKVYFVSVYDGSIIDKTICK